MTFSSTSRTLALASTTAAVLTLAACTTTAPGSKKPWPECASAQELDTPPKILRRGQPRIQEHWFPEGKQLNVVLTFEVTPEGKMGRHKYEPAEMDSRVFQAFERSLKDWRFKPGMHKGQPVSVCFAQPYDLIFEGSEEASSDTKAPKQ
nr:hypothetical protein [Comamonas testosteroni]